MKTGQYRFIDEAANAAIARFQAEQELLEEDLSDEDLAAIEQGLAQLNRGEGLPWEQVREELRIEVICRG